MPGDRQGRVAVAVSLLLLSLGATAARAGDPPAPAPDRSAFSLFSPTPDAALRALCTDRPTKSTSPCTVEAGRVQLETDLFNVTVDHSGGADTTTWTALNPTIKLGLTDTLDAELSLAPWVDVVSRDRAGGARTHASGLGDLYLKFKWSLMGDNGGPVAIGLVPWVKVPTAAAGVGNGETEMGLIAPANLVLPAGWSLVVDPEVDALENAAGDGRHVNIAGLLSFSHALSNTVTASAEIWIDANFDPRGWVTQVSADFGAAWIPAKVPNWQLDGGVNVGLDRDTPAAQVYLGISHRF
jgi:hypothetical protein